MRTTPICATRKGEASKRRFWLTVPVLAAAGVLFVPSLIVRSSQQPAALLLAQGVIAGLLLGLGRQGLDILGLRLLAASIGATLGLLVGGAGSSPLCAGLQGCFQWFALGVVFISIFIGVALSLVALPTTMLWNRGVANLKPELPWGRVPKPRAWWQWLLLVLAVVVGLFGLQLALGIPSPP
jgi:hypothetical protein